MPSESVARGVLVVDDDANVRAALAEVLIGQGVPVTEAGDGAVALALLQNGLRPALIFLDLMMPGVDGRAFRIEQARDPALRAIPTVVMTGARVDLNALGRELGVVRVIAKPVDYDDVLALVSHHGASAA